MTMPKRRPSSEEPAAIAIRRRRAEIGKSQEMVALDSHILNQTTVSELENGRYELVNLTAARLAGLARGLNWGLAELEQATGVNLGMAAYESSTLERDIHQAGPDLRRYPLPVIEAGAGPPWTNPNAEMIELALPELRALEKGEAFAVRLRGSSMERWAPDGALAIMRRADAADVGKVVAVWVADNGVVIKRFLGLYGELLSLASDTHAGPVVEQPPVGSKIIGVAIGRYVPEP